jgi:uncharacterized protein YeaO (DUF488 family)
LKIYTSYFGNIKNIPKDIIPISISLYTPKYFIGDSYIDVAPTKEILMDWKNGKKDDEAIGHYIRMYKSKVLRKLDAQKIYNNLKLLSKGKDVVLICYEKPNEFCHRHLLAEFLEEKLNIKIIEL